MEILTALREYWEFFLAIITGYGGWQLSKVQARRNKNKAIQEELVTVKNLKGLVDELSREFDRLSRELLENKESLLELKAANIELLKENKELKEVIKELRERIKKLEDE